MLNKKTTTAAVEAAEKKEAPVAAVKAEEVKKEEVKKEEVKKEEVKKEAPKKAPRKAPAKKETAKEVKTSLFVQFAGKEFTEKTLVAAAKKAYTKLGNKAADIKSIEIYVKPEESAAYYVVNGVGSDDYKIEL